MAIEDGRGLEGGQQVDDLRTVAGEPVPVRLQVPQRTMREDDNRLTAIERLQIASQPCELFVAHQAFRVRDVVQRNEMDSLVIEALMGDAEILLERRAPVGGGVMLARQEDRAQARQRLDDLLELGHAL